LKDIDQICSFYSAEYLSLDNHLYMHLLFTPIIFHHKYLLHLLNLELNLDLQPFANLLFGYP
jgi:hypothetical protein